MTPDKILDILDPISITIGAFLGISAVLTETKRSNGKITAWGRIAVIGIAITSVFSIIQTYLKHEKELREKNEQQSRENIKLGEDLLRYKNQIALQDSVLQKMDTSLKREVIVQSKADKLLIKVSEGMIMQNKSFKKQIEINNNTIRTLNPIFPFGIRFNLKVILDSNISEELKKCNLKIQMIAKTMKSKSLFEFAGIEYLDDSNFIVTKNFLDYNILEENILAPFYISIYKGVKPAENSEVRIGQYLNRKLTKNSVTASEEHFSLAGDLIGEAYPAIFESKKINYMGKVYLNTPYQITYSYIHKVYGAKIDSKIVDILLDKGKYRSPNDLAGSKLLIILFSPSGIKQIENVSLFFPPNFSRELIIPSRQSAYTIDSAFISVKKLSIPFVSN